MPQEYNDKLMGGIILTGGGSQMNEIRKAFTAVTGIHKIRIAGTVNQKVSSTDKDVNAHDGMMNTALGLLAKGDMNCAGSIIKPVQDLFETEVRTSPTEEYYIRTENHKPDEAGRVESPYEKERRERVRQHEEKVIHYETRNSSEGGWFSRGYRSFQEFVTKIISAEEE